MVDATWHDSGNEDPVPDTYLLVGRESKGLYITVEKKQTETEYTFFPTAGGEFCPAGSDRQNSYLENNGSSAAPGPTP
ncbi:MAG: hypothetical protein V8Q57_07635 [Blautia sp.]